MALYHKYRPQKFSEVIGQDHIIKTISRQIITNTLAHAYIFSGSRGLGKTTVSRIVAKAINCTNRAPESAEPCNNCTLCEAITNGRSIDVIEIDAASNTGVDNVRENIIENVQFQPTQAKYKVFIIDEVHMLSTSSFNALLKTLEEPPRYALFILATTELQKIPETILSRCQRYVFSRVPKNILTGILDKISQEENIILDDDVKEAIISKAEGGVRDTVSLLDQIMSTGEKHITRTEASIFLPISPLSDTVVFLENLIDKKADLAMKFIQTLSLEGRDMPTFLETLLETLRVIMITKIQGHASLTNDLTAELLHTFETLAKKISSSELLHLIDITLKRRASLKNTSVPELPLELIVLEWMQTNPESTPTSHVPKTSTADPVVPNPQKEPTKTIETPLPPTTPPLTEVLSPPKPISPDFQVLKNKWSEVLKCVEKRSPSLVSLLKSSILLSLENNLVTLQVQYKLHQDKFNQKEYKKMMEESLQECLGSTLGVQTVVAQKSLETEHNAPDIENLAAAFGGVVV